MATRPLQGRRIVVTRPEAQAGALAALLREHGAEPIICPAIAIAPPADYAALDAAIADLKTFDRLIVTSANGVHALLGRMVEQGCDTAALRRLSIGAIGPATARALEEYELQASFVPTAYVAEAILDEIGDVAGQRILLPRADIAREALAVGLRAKGALVNEVAAYRTVPGEGARELAVRLQRREIDAVTFTSSSTVRYLLDGLGAAGLGRDQARELLQHSTIACIGPITAATAREQGLSVDIEAREYTSDGLVAALLEWFGQPVAKEP
jgi:uroporphyrinogen-III synthase